MTVRAKIFFFIAKLQKKNFINHLKDLQSSFNLEKNNQKLKRFIQFATTSSPYYKNYNDFQELPIMNKTKVKKNYNELKTKFMHKNNHVMKTSGSSGVPFQIHQDKDKRNRVIAELIYFNTQAGYNFGSKLIYFKNTDDSKFSHLKNLVVKNTINIDVKNLNDENLFKIYNKINKNKRVNILGYASAIEKIGVYILNNNLEIKNGSINSIITTSELLTEKNKSVWKKINGIDVVSRYANQENGFLAQTIPGEKGYKLNHSSYYFEFINLNDDEPALPGERSRIVITDLYNKAVPLIRYDTGDVGVYSVNDNGEKVLMSLEGRMRDYILDLNGNLLSPSVITKMMWDFNEIDGFQFVQESSYKYTLLIIDSKKSYSDISLIHKLKDILGTDAIIAIKRVDNIQKLPSGKIQLVKNKYKNL